MWINLNEWKIEILINILLKIKIIILGKANWKLKLKRVKLNFEWFIPNTKMKSKIQFR